MAENPTNTKATNSQIIGSAGKKLILAQGLKLLFSRNKRKYKSRINKKTRPETVEEGGGIKKFEKLML